MKKLFTVLMLTLALNFLALAGGVGYLYRTGRLDKAKIAQIRELIFPPPATASTTRPSDNSGTAVATVNGLLATVSGKPVIEQVDLIRRSLDTQMLQLDRRERELADRQRQLDAATQKLASDRTALDQRDKDLTAREQAAQQLQSDAGFQNSLALYSTMPAKQAKTMFMTLNEDTVQQYLQAMDTRTATKIIKEFKTPAETAFIERVLERIRQAQASTTNGTSP
jgi:flagellar motility protein MotE (MotC chaperone)